MTDTTGTRERLNSVPLFQFLFKRRKHLIIVALVAIVASAILSAPYFILPLYKSTVVMFPSSSNSISKALLSEHADAKQDVLEFGEDEQIEQMLQILKSNYIRDRIIDKYDLFTHYHIDTAGRYKNTRLYKRYESNIRFKRTEYSAVQVVVLDSDAQMAMDIANDIAVLYDSTKNLMKRERAMRAFRIVETEFQKMKQLVKTKEDSLRVLRKYGVYDYESQSEMINRQLAMEIAAGHQAGVKALEAKLEVLANYGGAYVSLRDALEHDKLQLSELKAKYEEAKVDAMEQLPQKFVVNWAYKAEKKSYPVRWLIVVLSTLSALFLASLLLVLLNSFQRFRQFE